MPAAAAPAFICNCPPHCHACPDMGGDVMPRCWGCIDLPPGVDWRSRCICETESECARNAVRSLLANHRRFFSRELAAALEHFAATPSSRPTKIRPAGKRPPRSARKEEE